MTRAAFVALAALVAAVGSSGPLESSDAVLGRFVGVWRTEAQIRHAGPPVSERRTLGRASGRVTLDGRFVEFRTSSIDPPGLNELQLMAYDAEAGVYRQWVSDSDGYRHEAVGRWNHATSTLTWRGQAGGATVVIEDRWVSGDRLEWTLTRTSAEGRLLQTIEGVVSRSAAHTPRP